MARFTKREFQVGEYWLSQRPNSSAWYRTWNDAQARQTRRVSLNTEDVEEARRRLAEWYAAQFQAPTEDLPPSAVKLAEVFLDYWNGQGSKLRSHETSKIHLRYWTDFWGDVSVAAVRDVRKQEAFRLWLSDRGLAHNSINRCLEVGRAAIRRAWKRGVISSAPFVQMLPTIETAPMGRPLSREEAGALYQGATQDHVRHIILIGLATGARPEAITDLTWDRIDFKSGLIRLNPEGRAQNKKYRPIVKIGPAFLDYLRSAEKKRQGEFVIMFRNKRIRRLDTGWRKALAAAKLDRRVNLYSLRHTVARYLRMEGVDTMEIANLLGHRKLGFDMTMRYAPHAPDYLKKSTDVLDGLISFCLTACQLRATEEVSDPLGAFASEEISQIQSETWLAKSS